MCRCNTIVVFSLETISFSVKHISVDWASVSWSVIYQMVPWEYLITYGMLAPCLHNLSKHDLKQVKKEPKET